jgi:hypothetical protein
MTLGSLGRRKSEKGIQPVAIIGCGPITEGIARPVQEAVHYLPSLRERSFLIPSAAKKLVRVAEPVRISGYLRYRGVYRVYPVQIPNPGPKAFAAACAVLLAAIVGSLVLTSPHRETLRNSGFSQQARRANGLAGGTPNGSISMTTSAGGFPC